jgi:hypothetical protein
MNEPVRALTSESPPLCQEAKEPAAPQNRAAALVAAVNALGEQQTATEARLNAMRAWAETVNGQLKKIEAGFGSLDSVTGLLAEQIAALNHSTDRSDRALPSTAARPHDAPDEVMGYRPSPEQLAQLFTALAEWQAAAPGLGKTGTAAFKTNSGNDASYDYATPGDVSALARTAGAQGLSHFHREVAMASYSVIRTYLLHKAGGFVWCDVPLLQKENRLLSPIQVWSAACTAAKRMGILSVMGILPADTDEAGNPTGGGGGGRQGGGRPPGGGDPPKPPPLPAANIRRIGAAAGPTGAPNGTAPVSQPQPAAIRAHS